MGMGGMGMGGLGMGGPGMNAGGLDGADGPVFDESSKEAGKVVDRSDFVVQFIWIPTIERDRKAVEPKSAESTPGTDGSATPPAAATP